MLTSHSTSQVAIPKSLLKLPCLPGHQKSPTTNQDVFKSLGAKEKLFSDCHYAAILSMSHLTLMFNYAACKMIENEKY